MNGNRPDNYSLHSDYVKEVSGMYDQSDEAWRISFGAGIWPKTTVTFFPECEGVKMSAADSPDYKEGKERAILGLVLLHIIRSGENVMVEL